LNKNQRRDLHEAINSLSYYSVAHIVKKNFPKLPVARIDAVAKQVIREAHSMISPKANK
jgi:hypothetical protein